MSGGGMYASRTDDRLEARQMKVPNAGAACFEPFPFPFFFFFFFFPSL